MTSFSLDDNQANFQIRAYKPGHIQVNERLLTCNLIIAADRLIENWAPQTVADLRLEHLLEAVALEPEILLIGTGEKQVFLNQDTYGEILNRGIGVEIMGTGAACRTYNVLTSENRRVVAALLLK